MDDNERTEAGQSQHDVSQLQGEPASSGYPEEEPGSAGDEDTGGGQTQNRSGNPRIENEDSPEGASREGSQSTGNPNAAG
jgi:hypothetical protein